MIEVDDTAAEKERKANDRSKKNAGKKFVARIFFF
jgi:hypothetical protein